MNEWIWVFICIITSLITYFIGKSKGYEEGWIEGSHNQIELNDAKQKENVSEDSR